jgi:hypothetical protein
MRGGIDLCDPGAIALAQQIDVLVSQRHTGVLEIFDNLRDGVAAKVDTVLRHSGGRLPYRSTKVRPGCGSQKILPDPPHRPPNLRSIELH